MEKQRRLFIQSKSKNCHELYFTSKKVWYDKFGETWRRRIFLSFPFFMILHDEILENRLRASLHRPKVLQWALGTSTCFRFWRKKTNLGGERAHALFRCTANHQICRMASLKWCEYVLVKAVSTIQSNEVQLYRETGFIWFRGYSF